MSSTDPGFQAALDEAESGLQQGGIPIGAALVSKDGKLLGVGHNMKVQQGSSILHAEMSALENCGRIPASLIEGGTMYTTLSPCAMCTGACILYKVGRVIIGENRTFLGGEEYLKSKGIEVIVLDDQTCKEKMDRFRKEHPLAWKNNTDEWSV